MSTNIQANLTLNTAQAQASFNSFAASIGSAKFAQPLGRISGDAAEFTKSLSAATARVTAFGLTAGAIYKVSQAIREGAKATIEVDKQLIELNTYIGKSRDELEGFSQSLFKVAKNSAVPFEAAAEAAKEFARQGISANEILKRTGSALTLARIAGISYTQAVTGITTAINSFNKEALSTEDIVNKLIAVDTRFAVSSAQLNEALSRVGSSAEESGISLDKLIATVTAAQQITGRGGAVIGNALKTIFTRLQRPEVLTQLEQLGVAVKDQGGYLLDGISILKNYADATKNLSQTEKARTAELVGGIYQINQVNALIKDLSSSNSVYADALRVSSAATDEAKKKNEELNKSMSALLQQTKTSAQEAAAALGSSLLDPLVKLGSTVSEVLLKLVSPNSDLFGQGEDSGKKFADGLRKGAASILGKTLGAGGLPILAATGGLLAAKFVKFGVSSLKELGKASTEMFTSEKELQIQKRINDTLRQNPAIVDNVISRKMNLVQAEAEVLRLIQQQNTSLLTQSRITGRVSSTVTSAQKTAKKGFRIFAEGYIPDTGVAEAAATLEENTARQMGAVNPKARVIQATIKGETGPIIVNDQETVIPNYANGETAIIPNYRKLDEIPRMAKGYIPNFAWSKSNQMPKDFLIKYPKSQAAIKAGRMYSPEVRAMLGRLQTGEKIDRDLLDSLIERDIPIREVAPPSSVKDLPSKALIKNALDKEQAKRASKLSELPAGSEITVRQDVPSMTRKGVGVVKTESSGGFKSYDSFVAFDNPVMSNSPGLQRASLAIGAGKQKTPLLKISGTLSKDQSLPKDLEKWTQTGFNPDRHSYYYDRKTKKPVVGGQQAIQIGNTVFVKEAIHGNREDFSYAKGYIPNFAKQRLGGGFFGEFFGLRGSLGRKDFFDPKSNRTKSNVANEYVAAQELGQMIGAGQLNPIFKTPEIYGSLEKSIQKSSIYKKVIAGKTGKDLALDLDPYTGERQGFDKFYNLIAGRAQMQIDMGGRMKADDLVGKYDNLMFNEKSETILSKVLRRNYGKLIKSIESKDFEESEAQMDRILTSIAKKGGEINIVDTGVFGLNSDLAKKRTKGLSRLGYKDEFAYGPTFLNQGYIPNFAKRRDVIQRIGKKEIFARFEKHFEKGKDYQGFYNIHGEEFNNRKLTAQEAKIYANITSAISPSVPDYVAAQFAAPIFNRFMQTRSTNVEDYFDLAPSKIVSRHKNVFGLGLFGVKGTLSKKGNIRTRDDVRRSGLSKALRGVDLGSDDTAKTRHYARAILQDKTAFPIDTNVIQAILGGKKPSKTEAAKLVSLANEFATLNKIETGAAGLQAAIFKSNSKHTEKYSPDTVRSALSGIQGRSGGYVPNFANINAEKLILGGRGNNLLLTSPYDSLKASLDPSSQISGGIGYGLKFPDRSYASTARSAGVDAMQALHDYAKKQGGRAYYAPHVPTGAISKFGTAAGGMNKRNIFFLQQLISKNKKDFPRSFVQTVLSINPANASLTQTGMLYDAAVKHLSKKGLSSIAIGKKFREGTAGLHDEMVEKYAGKNKYSISGIASRISDVGGSAIAPSSYHALYPKSTYADSQFSSAEGIDIVNEFEKLTGVKAAGTTIQKYSRSGKPINTPDPIGTRYQPLSSFLPFGVRFDQGDAISKMFGGLAEGYIPNFSGLSDAVSREKTMSGLPASQIMAHFDRGGNPVAVTNKRDEPNGLKDVPNFALPSRQLVTILSRLGLLKGRNNLANPISAGVELFAGSAASSTLDTLAENELIDPRASTFANVAIPGAIGLKNIGKGIFGKGSKIQRGVAIASGATQLTAGTLAGFQGGADLGNRINIKKFEQALDRSKKTFQDLTENTLELSNSLAKLDDAYRDPKADPKQILKLSASIADLLSKVKGSNPELVSRLASETSLAGKQAILEDNAKESQRIQSVRQEALKFSSKGTILGKDAPKELDSFFRSVINSGNQDLLKQDLSKAGPANFSEVLSKGGLNVQELSSVFKTDELKKSFLDALKLTQQLNELSSNQEAAIIDVSRPLTRKKQQTEDRREVRASISKALEDQLPELASFAGGFSKRAGISAASDASLAIKNTQSSVSFQNSLLAQLSDKEFTKGLPSEVQAKLNAIETPSTATGRDLESIKQLPGLSKAQVAGIEKLIGFNAQQTREIQKAGTIANETKNIQLKFLALQEKLAFGGDIKTSINPQMRAESMSAGLRGPLTYQLGTLFGSRRTQLGGTTDFLTETMQKYPGLLQTKGGKEPGDVSAVKRELTGLNAMDMQRDLLKRANMAQMMGLGQTSGLLRNKAFDSKYLFESAGLKADALFGSPEVPGEVKSSMQNYERFGVQSAKQAKADDSALKQVEDLLVPIKQQITEQATALGQGLVSGFEASLKSTFGDKGIRADVVNLVASQVKGNASEAGAAQASDGPPVKNFANPVNDAVTREKIALAKRGIMGVPNFAMAGINLERSPNLVTASNPQGFGVTNSIDEKNGLRSLGMRSSGYVPNYAKSRMEELLERIYGPRADAPKPVIPSDPVPILGVSQKTMPFFPERLVNETYPFGNKPSIGNINPTVKPGVTLRAQDPSTGKFLSKSEADLRQRIEQGRSAKAAKKAQLAQGSPAGFSGYLKKPGLQEMLALAPEEQARIRRGVFESSQRAGAAQVAAYQKTFLAQKASEFQPGAQSGGLKMLPRGQSSEPLFSGKNKTQTSPLGLLPKGRVTFTGQAYVPAGAAADRVRELQGETRTRIGSPSLKMQSERVIPSLKPSLKLLNKNPYFNAFSASTEKESRSILEKAIRENFKLAQQEERQAAANRYFERTAPQRAEIQARLAKEAADKIRSGQKIDLSNVIRGYGTTAFSKGRSADLRDVVSKLSFSPKDNVASNFKEYTPEEVNKILSRKQAAPSPGAAPSSPVSAMRPPGSPSPATSGILNKLKGAGKFGLKGLGVAGSVGFGIGQGLESYSSAKEGKYGQATLAGLSSAASFAGFVKGAGKVAGPAGVVLGGLGDFETKDLTLAREWKDIFGRKGEEESLGVGDAIGTALGAIGSAPATVGLLGYRTGNILENKLGIGNKLGDLAAGSRTSRASYEAGIRPKGGTTVNEAVKANQLASKKSELVGQINNLNQIAGNPLISRDFQVSASIRGQEFEETERTKELAKELEKQGKANIARIISGGNAVRDAETARLNKESSEQEEARSSKLRKSFLESFDKNAEANGYTTTRDKANYLLGQEGQNGLGSFKPTDFKDPGFAKSFDIYKTAKEKEAAREANRVVPKSAIEFKDRPIPSFPQDVLEEATRRRVSAERVMQDRAGFGGGFMTADEVNVRTGGLAQGRALSEINAQETRETGFPKDVLEEAMRRRVPAEQVMQERGLGAVPNFAAMSNNMMSSGDVYSRMRSSAPRNFAPSYAQGSVPNFAAGDFTNAVTEALKTGITSAFPGGAGPSSNVSNSNVINIDGRSSIQNAPDEAMQGIISILFDKIPELKKLGPAALNFKK